MSTVIQELHEKITYEIGSWKTEKDKAQVFLNTLLKKIHCLRYDVHNKIIDLDF